MGQFPGECLNSLARKRYCFCRVWRLFQRLINEYIFIKIVSFDFVIGIPNYLWGIFFIEDYLFKVFHPEEFFPAKKYPYECSSNKQERNEVNLLRSPGRKYQSNCRISVSIDPLANVFSVCIIYILLILMANLLFELIDLRIQQVLLFIQKISIEIKVNFSLFPEKDFDVFC